MQVVYEQASLTIDPEVHSQMKQSTGSPDLTALDFLQAGVTAQCLVSYHNSNVSLKVCVPTEVFCHGRFFSPLVHDIMAVVIHPAM